MQTAPQQPEPHTLWSVKLAASSHEARKLTDDELLILPTDLCASQTFPGARPVLRASCTPSQVRLYEGPCLHPPPDHILLGTQSAHALQHRPQPLHVNCLCKWVCKGVRVLLKRGLPAPATVHLSVWSAGRRTHVVASPAAAGRCGGTCCVLATCALSPGCRCGSATHRARNTSRFSRVPPSCASVDSSRTTTAAGHNTTPLVSATDGNSSAQGHQTHQTHQCLRRLKGTGSGIWQLRASWEARRI